MNKSTQPSPANAKPSPPPKRERVNTKLLFLPPVGEGGRFVPADGGCLSFGILGLFVFCNLLFVIAGAAGAMGEVPSTTEVVNPTIEYVRDFGLAGSGERQFYYPRDPKVAGVGDP